MSDRKNSKERIAVLSDGTCDTADSYVRAILAQFDRATAELIRFPKLRHQTEIENALDQLSPPYLVAYTFASERLRKVIWAEAKKRNLLGVDLLYPTIDVFAKFLNSAPTEETGTLHSTRAVNYFERMEAIEFTVKHDDGLRMNDLQQAEIILVGVSRTSKTPTSMYLAHKGYRVANIPFVPGVKFPESVAKAKAAGSKVILLTITTDHLERIRRSRLDRLGSAPNAADTYLNPQRIAEELEAAHKLAKQNQWTIIDVTNKAVEETAAEILLLVSAKGS